MRISVVIPLYNKQETIQGALQSVFQQTVQPLEIIVVNDGSTDGSEKIVEALQHPLVHLVHQTNAGVSSARNKGIELAKGDWIAFLDADDEWKPEFLETIQFLNLNYPQAGVLATSYLLQDYKGNINPIILNKIPFKGEHGILNNYFEVAACSNPPISSISLVVKKDELKKIKGFPIGIKSGEDLLTWARLALNTSIAYHLKPLSVFIQDPAHTYQNKPNRIPETPDSVGIALKELLYVHPANFGLKKYLAHWHKMRASIFLRLNKRSLARKESLLSLKFNAKQYKIVIYLILSFLPFTLITTSFKKIASK